MTSRLVKNVGWRKSAILALAAMAVLIKCAGRHPGEDIASTTQAVKVTDLYKDNATQFLPNAGTETGSVLFPTGTAQCDPVVDGKTTGRAFVVHGGGGGGRAQVALY